jgi:exoribonuclease R
MSNIITTQVRLLVSDRNYTECKYVDINSNVPQDYIDIDINPYDRKMFNGDILNVNNHNVISLIKDKKTVLAGVLVLKNNKTYGRTENKKRLYYKCIPDDKHLPIFLVPYDLKIGFSKSYKNKYVTFTYDSWLGDHPCGLLHETLGDVDNLEVFYEYQLYCKSLHYSMIHFTKETRQLLNKKTYEEYIEQIVLNENYNIYDYRDKYIFTIDPKSSTDYDDGFSIEKYYNNDTQTGWRINVYISNVFLWLETLNLWSSFTKRVSTIYLPDRKRPMLPTILSDTLCSLQENENRFALTMEIVINNDGSINEDEDILYKNVIIKVKKNYSYEDNKIFLDEHYNNLFNISKIISKTVKTNHDLVSFWMVFMNMKVGSNLNDKKTGIFRTAFIRDKELRTDIDTKLNEDTIRVIQTWNNSMGQYVLYKDDISLQHEMMSLYKNKFQNKSINAYIHITSPIRRLVDLLNQIQFLNNFSLVNHISNDAKEFYNKWTCELDFVNISMRSIRKVQNECELLTRCINDVNILNKPHNGVIFDKLLKNDGLYSYMVYLEEIKMLSKIIITTELENYSSHKFNLFLFEDEDKVQRKIRIQLVNK